MRTKCKKTLEGFSLGEVLLSIAVLTVGILPILGALTSALNTSFDSRDTIIAAGLAQEGAELVVNVRDNAALRDPMDPFEDFSPGVRICKIGIGIVADILVNPTVEDIPCNGSGDDYSLIDNPGNTFYAPGGSGTVTKFYRKIFIDYNNGLQTMSVASAVYWGAYDPAANDVGTDCVPANECVRSEMTLRPWK